LHKWKLTQAERKPVVILHHLHRENKVEHLRRKELISGSATGEPVSPSGASD